MWLNCGYSASPMVGPPSDVTALLRQIGRGDDAAKPELYARVYERLHAMARAQMKGERGGHTLQPTVLVHDAFLQLVDKHAPWSDRAHFYRVAAIAMRHLLVNHAKGRLRLKRGGDRERVPLQGIEEPGDERALDLVALDEALTKLGERDPRKRELVELRYFAQLDIEETARLLELSPASVKREWTVTKTWLLREIQKGDEEP